MFDVSNHVAPHLICSSLSACARCSVSLMAVLLARNNSLIWLKQMLDPVLSMCRLQSQLTARPALSKADAKQVPSQKVMVSSYSSSTNTPLAASPSNSSTEVIHP